MRQIVGLSCSAALNGSAVAACNGFAILTSSLRPLPPRARTPQMLTHFGGFSSSQHLTIKNAPIKGAYFYYGATDGNNIELFGEDEMPIILPDKGLYTYRNLVCIMKQCTQTYYNIRKILGLECI